MAPDAVFGEIAVRRGFLTREQLDHLLERQARLRDRGNDVTLGEVAQERRVLTSSQVQRILALQEEVGKRARQKRAARSQAITGRLVEEEGQEPGLAFGLVGRSVLGRQPENAVPVSDADCSRQHAVIEFDHEQRQHTVVDLNSQNGTFVNDRAVASPVTLVPGDRIRLGRTVLRYEGLSSGTTDDSPPHPEMPSQIFQETGSFPAIQPSADREPPREDRSGPTRFIYRPNLGMPPAGRSPRLGAALVCPHCWHEFTVENTLFVASHRDLAGDPVLGPDAAQRFLPSRFTPAGNAIDSMGSECHDRACPRCHLRIPRALYDAPPLFLSIVGAPASGKSYFLTALVWELRRVLAEGFHLDFADADAETNQWLNAYEEALFLSADPDRPVYLRKTEMQGDVYDAVGLDGMPVLLPKPCVFVIRPQERHTRVQMGRRDLARNLVLYDNAGEHFQPGMDTSANPGTQHLVRSQAILFLFDPTRDPRFARRCGVRDETGARPQRQDVLLTEMIGRIARQRALPAGEKTDTPLVVVVTKFDVWRSLTPVDLSRSPIRESKTLSVSALDLDTVATAALATRRLLQESCPEIVSVAEGFSRQVFYVPVSALGHAPARGEEGAFAVRPSDIHPLWVTIPMLYVLAQLGLIAIADHPSPVGLAPGVLVEPAGDRIRVRLPEGGIEYVLPPSFAGRTLTCPASGARFRIPALA